MIFDRFFRKTKNISNVQPVEFLSGTSSFSPWDGDSYSNDIFRAAVDAIARNAGKLKGTHFIQNGDMKQPAEDKLNRLLQVQPHIRDLVIGRQTEIAYSGGKAVSH